MGSDTLSDTATSMVATPAEILRPSRFLFLERSSTTTTIAGRARRSSPYAGGKSIWGGYSSGRSPRSVWRATSTYSTGASRNTDPVGLRRWRVPWLMRPQGSSVVALQTPGLPEPWLIGKLPHHLAQYPVAND